MSRSSRIAVALGALSLACLTAPSIAYEFKTHGGTGEALRWFIPETTVRLSTVAPDDVPWDAIEPIVTASYAAWEVPGAAVPQVDVVGTTDAETITTPTNDNPDTDNIVVFYKSAQQWQTLPMSQSSYIALTIIASYDTGEILDADIAMNDGRYAFSTDDAPGDASAIDLQASLTHEVGHFFGLDHSADADATMFANYTDDASGRLAARTLSGDDEDGIAALYALPIPEQPDPETPNDGGDPGCAAGASSPAWPALLAFAIVGPWWTRRRRRGCAVA